jgi:hypothetical protein
MVRPSRHGPALVDCRRRWTSASWGSWRSSPPLGGSIWEGTSSVPCWPCSSSKPTARCRWIASSTCCGMVARRRRGSARCGPMCPTCAGSWSRGGRPVNRPGCSPASRAATSCTWRPRSSTPPASSGWSKRAAPPATRRRQLKSSRTRWPCGGDRRWPTSPTSRSPGRPGPGSRSAGSRPWRSTSRRRWSAADTRPSSPTWRCWSQRTPCGSGCGSCSCWPCTGAAARPTRCGPTRPAAGCWPRSWASTRGRRCRPWSGPSSTMTPASTGPGWHRPGRWVSSAATSNWPSWARTWARRSPGPGAPS